MQCKKKVREGGGGVGWVRNKSQSEMEEEEVKRRVARKEGEGEEREGQLVRGSVVNWEGEGQLGRAWENIWVSGGRRLLCLLDPLQPGLIWGQIKLPCRNGPGIARPISINRDCQDGPAHRLRPILTVLDFGDG